MSTSLSQDELASQSTLIVEENERFSKHHPLLNLLIMTVGPFLTFIGMSVLDSIDLIIISYRFKKEPNSYTVQIIGIGFFVLQICMDIGMYLQQSIIVRVSSLIGQGKRDEASQLTVDIYRISLLLNFIMTIIVTFIARPLMNFAGCTPDLIEKCMLLIISTIAAIPFSTIFHVGTGFLQAIGKPVLNGFLHLVASCLQTFIITPFLQFVVRIDVTLSNISQPIAQSIVGIAIFTFIFKGKYSLKPTFQMFFNGFSNETPKALLMSIPMIPTQLFALLPSSLILRFMTSASSSDSHKTDVIAVYTILQKMFMIGMAIPSSLSIGFLTAATHSIAQNNYKRMLITLCYAMMIVLVFFLIFIPLIIINPVLIMKIFGVSSKSQLEIAKKMVPIPFYTFPIGNCCFFLINFFLAAGKLFYSNITSIVQLISICIGSKVLSVKYPNDPIKQMFSYTISDLSSVLLTSFLFLITLIPLIKKSKSK